MSSIETIAVPLPAVALAATLIPGPLFSSNLFWALLCSHCTALCGIDWDGLPAGWVAKSGFCS